VNRTRKRKPQSGRNVKRTFICNEGDSCMTADEQSASLLLLLELVRVREPENTDLSRERANTAAMAQNGYVNRLKRSQHKKIERAKHEGANS